MAKSLKSEYKKFMLPDPNVRHGYRESGSGKKGLVICEKCKIFYYKKAWHHDAENFIAKRENKDLPVNFALCPACKMIADKQYEGRIVIKGFPEKLEFDLLALIRGYCKRAYDRDHLDRLIEIKKEGADWIVFTTENQLAHKLAKKIKDAFNEVKVKTSFDAAPSDVALITVEFLSP